MIKSFASIVATTAMFIGVAAADDPTKSADADATFKSLDKNADEKLSKAEATSDSMLSQHFSAADADSDGFLSKREVTAHMKEMKGMKDKDEPKKNY